MCELTKMWLVKIIFVLLMLLLLFFLFIFFTVDIGPRESCLVASTSSIPFWKRWPARVDDMREYWNANPM